MLINTIIVKLATRCNLDCTYCYWFRDRTVFEKPSLLTDDARRALLRKLEVHIANNGLRKFNLVFHGGEPLLFGKKRFAGFCEELRILEAATNCKFSLGVTTNGALIYS